MLRDYIEKLDKELTHTIHNHKGEQRRRDALDLLERLTTASTELTALEADLYLIHADYDPADLRSVEEILYDIK